MTPTSPRPGSVAPYPPAGGTPDVPSQQQDEARAIAIQAVAELALGVRILDAEVAQGAARRDVQRTLTSLRRVIQVLDDATARDGRRQGFTR